MQVSVCVCVCLALDNVCLSVRVCMYQINTCAHASTQTNLPTVQTTLYIIVSGGQKVLLYRRAHVHMQSGVKNRDTQPKVGDMKLSTDPLTRPQCTLRTPHMYTNPQISQLLKTMQMSGVCVCVHVCVCVCTLCPPNPTGHSLTQFPGLLGHTSCLRHPCGVVLYYGQSLCWNE